MAGQSDDSEMCMPTSLLEQIAECFCHDDGSLPSIEINQLSSRGVSAIYRMLRKRSQFTGNGPFVFWSRTQEACVPIDSVSDAAGLVATGHAEAFHFCASGIKAAGVELPVLGIFVWPDGIELDYRMGSDWGSAQISGFFELLKNCCALDPAAVVMPGRDGPSCPERFERAWASYNGIMRT